MLEIDRKVYNLLPDGEFNSKDVDKSIKHLNLSQDTDDLIDRFRRNKMILRGYGDPVFFYIKNNI